MAIEMLYELTKGEAIITTGVGQHQMWTGQYYKFTSPRQLLTSPGWARWASAIRPPWAPRSPGPINSH